MCENSIINHISPNYADITRQPFEIFPLPLCFRDILPQKYRLVQIQYAPTSYMTRCHEIVGISSLQEIA